MNRHGKLTGSRLHRFRGIFDPKIAESFGVRSFVGEYFSVITFIALLLCLAIFISSVGAEFGYLTNPALYSGLVILGLLAHSLRSSRPWRPMLVALAILSVLLVFYALLWTQPYYYLWVISLVVLVYLTQGVGRASVWLALTISCVAAVLVYYSTGDLIQAKIDLPLAVSTSVFVVAVVLGFYMHDRALQRYLASFQDSSLRLSEENAKRSALIDALADGIIVADTNGKITYLNRRATELMGVEKISDLEGVVGQGITNSVKLLDMQDNPINEADRPESYVLRTGEKINTENAPLSYKMLRLDGESFPIETAISPIRAGQNNFGIIQIFRDASWQQEISEAKNEFVSLASHQLRTPLASISWNCEQLQWPENFDSMNQEQKDIVAEIRKSSENMTELVAALLDISRLELGTVEYNLQEIDVVGAARKAADGAKGLLAKKSNVEFTPLIANDEIVIRVDERYFGMVLDNLLSNSIKYTPEGEVRFEVKRVAAGVQVGGIDVLVSSALVVVKDTGYGIPEEQQSQIFSKMFRADNVRTTNVGGTGLGLYLVHTTINMMGGKTWFESVENEGTTFYVLFPVVG